MAIEKSTPNKSAKRFVVGQTEIIANGSGVKEPEQEPGLVDFVPGYEVLDILDGISGEKIGNSSKQTGHEISTDVPQECREGKLLGELDDRDREHGQECVDHDQAKPVVCQPAESLVHPRYGASLIFAARILEQPAGRDPTEEPEKDQGVFMLTKEAEV